MTNIQRLIAIRIKNIKESVKNAAKDMHSNLLKDTVESGDVVSGH